MADGGWRMADGGWGDIAVPGSGPGQAPEDGATGSDGGSPNPSPPQSNHSHDGREFGRASLSNILSRGGVRVMITGAEIVSL
jgi:hypothetical protein